MTELERALQALASQIDWPATPSLPVRFEQRRRRVARRLVVIAAAVLLGIGVALAVPDARSAVLRFLHLGGVTIERVSTLPAAQERPLAAYLGSPVSPAKAQDALGEPVRLPPSGARLQLYLGSGVVSVLLATPSPVLLSEFRSAGGAALLKKVVGSSTGIEQLPVAGGPGIWITGEEHVLIAPLAPPRLAGNTLIWQRGEITYRLEGPRLTRALALRLAGEVSG
jgi:hypothetical protein